MTKKKTDKRRPEFVAQLSEVSRARIAGVKRAKRAKRAKSVGKETAELPPAFRAQAARAMAALHAMSARMERNYSVAEKARNHPYVHPPRVRRALQAFQDANLPLPPDGKTALERQLEISLIRDRARTKRLAKVVRAVERKIADKWKKQIKQTD